MKTNPAILKYGNRYHNIGVGALFQYDTRDDVATPFEGVFLSAMGTLYGKYLGGNYNYEMLELEYRQFRQVFKRRSTLAWTAKTQIGMDNVPYSELPNFGNPFDLRGYAWGKYRDKSMAYGIIEYRHMFMSQEAYARGALWYRTSYSVTTPQKFPSGYRQRTRTEMGYLYEYDRSFLIVPTAHEKLCKK